MTVRVYPLVRTLFGPAEGDPVEYPEALHFHIDETTRTLHVTDDAHPHVLASYVDGRWSRAEVVDADVRTAVDRLAEWVAEHVDGEPSRSEGVVDTVIRLLSAQAETFPRNGAEARLAREASALAHMVNAALDAAPDGRLWQPAGAPADMDAAAPGLVLSDGNVDSLRNLAGFVLETIGDQPETDGPTGVGCYPPAEGTDDHVETVRPAQSFDTPPPADEVNPLAEVLSDDRIAAQVRSIVQDGTTAFVLTLHAAAAVPARDLPDLLERIESRPPVDIAADVAEAETVERMAKAIRGEWASASHTESYTWDHHQVDREFYRRLARAALAAMPPADEALRERVEGA